jgi:hypothetical protein
MSPMDSGFHIVAAWDGRNGPVTCQTCGCRLTSADGEWFHFGALAGRDARGCRVACVELPHDASGRAELLFDSLAGAR